MRSTKGRLRAIVMPEHIMPENVMPERVVVGSPATAADGKPINSNTGATDESDRK